MVFFTEERNIFMEDFFVKKWCLDAHCYYNAVYNRDPADDNLGEESYPEDEFEPHFDEEGNYITQPTVFHDCGKCPYARIDGEGDDYCVSPVDTIYFTEELADELLYDFIQKGLMKENGMFTDLPEDMYKAVDYIFWLFFTDADGELEFDELYRDDFTDEEFDAYIKILTYLEEGGTLEELEEVSEEEDAEEETSDTEEG
jgi:hypothetical protein